MSLPIIDKIFEMNVPYLQLRNEYFDDIKGIHGEHFWIFMLRDKVFVKKLTYIQVNQTVNKTVDVAIDYFKLERFDYDEYLDEENLILMGTRGCDEYKDVMYSVNGLVLIEEIKGLFHRRIKDCKRKNIKRVRNYIKNYAKEINTKSKAVNIIETQLKESMYNPQYKMCQNIMRRKFEKIFPAINKTQDEVNKEIYI